jgi:protease I
MARLRGQRVAVLVETLYEDLELHYPRLRFLEEGAEVHVVGPEAGRTYESKHGYAAKSTHAAKDVKGSDYAAVVVPGGYAPDHMRRTEAMVQLVRDAHAAQRVLAAICHGGWLLCSAPETVRGRRVGCFPSIRDDMVNAGATWVEGQSVTVDLPLVTSRTPDDLPDFCRALLGALTER